MSMTLVSLLLVTLVLVIFLVLVFSPFFLPIILIFRAIGYVMSNFSTLIALPLLVSFLVLVTKTLLVIVSTLDDSLEASYEHGNILVFIIGTIIFACG